MLLIRGIFEEWLRVEELLATQTWGRESPELKSTQCFPNSLYHKNHKKLLLQTEIPEPHLKPTMS